MKKIYGVFYAMLSAIAFGFMPIFAKIAYKGGATPVTVVFLRFMLSAIILLVYFSIKKIDYKLPKDSFMKVAFLGIVGYAATCLTLFMSYKYISVGLATIIHFVYPAIVTFLTCLIYKEKMNVNKIASLLLSISGVYVLIGFSSVKLNIVGVILAIVSGIFYSFYIIQIGYSRIRNIDSLVLTFYVSLFSSISVLIYGIFTDSISFRIEAYSYVSSLALAILCTVFALMAFNKGVKIIGSTYASILSTLEPITSIVLSAIIFSEGIYINTIVGSLLILISVYIILKKI